jgi:hypothetical protein
MSTTVTVPAAPELLTAPRPRGGVVAPDALKILEEPVGLLTELRAVALREPAAARSAAPIELSAYARSVWADQLEGLGVAPAVVTHVFATFRREIWLWLEGDRRWDQLAGHLAARVARRA